MLKHKLFSFTILPLLLVAPAFVLATSCTRNTANFAYVAADYDDDKAYTIDGTDWPGYISGSVKLVFNPTDLTCYIESNIDYTASNLSIPRRILHENQTYFLHNGGGKFHLKSDNITGFIRLYSNSKTIGGSDIDGQYSIDCPNASEVVLKSNSLTTLSKYSVNAKKVTLPSTAVTIDDYAFYDSSILENVYMPYVLTIGEKAFYGCSSLKSVNAPHVTTIKANAFYGCSSIETLDIINVLTIGENAFYDNKSLTRTLIPYVTVVPKNAFYNCISLTTIELLAATTISSMAFYNCNSLKVIDLPKGVSIGSEAFYNCTKIARIQLYKTISSIANDAFAGISASLTESSVLMLPATCPNKAITDYNILHDSIALGGYTFHKIYWIITKI